MVAQIRHSILLYVSLAWVTASIVSAQSTAIQGTRRIRGAFNKVKRKTVMYVGYGGRLEDPGQDQVTLVSRIESFPKTIAPKSTLVPKLVGKTKTPTIQDENDQDDQYDHGQNSAEPSAEPSREPDELVIAQILGDTSMGEPVPTGFGVGGVAAAAAGVGLVLIFLIVHFVAKFEKDDTPLKSKEEANEKDSPQTISLSNSVFEEAKSADQPFDLSGTFVLVKNENFEAFLEALDVSWAIRSAASLARPIHRITHKGNFLLIKFKSFPKTAYVINGPTVQTDIRGNLFEDAASYTENNHGVQILKQSVEENFSVRFIWQLSDDSIILTLTASFHDERESVESIHFFERTEERNI